MSGDRRGNDWALVGDALLTCHRPEAETVKVKVEIKGILFVCLCCIFVLRYLTAKVLGTIKSQNPKD